MSQSQLISPHRQITNGFICGPPFHQAFFVRYSDDKLKSHVIHVRDIYKFDCKAFDDTKPYVMKWFCAPNLQQPHVEYDSFGWDMHYYMGEVFSVGSKADMLNLKETTIRWKKIIGVLTQDEERRQYNKHLIKTYSRKTSSADKENKKEKGTNASSTSSAVKESVGEEGLLEDGGLGRIFDEEKSRVFMIIWFKNYVCLIGLHLQIYID
ncbi:UNVERIFIED_CONTAM: hypothetical protein B566_EDAN018630 [Ephemera danica]|nr:hypothetical protein B566_EDAN018630 [Ephemera danica]